MDIRVERYVLPKYEVKLQMPREWYLVTESIKGEVKAEYSFGKPVEGEVKLLASRYMGQWEQYATIVSLSPSDLGGAQFKIRPRLLGGQEVKLTARSRQAADAVVKPILIQPEGAERKEVRNVILKGGESRTLATAIPPGIVSGSARTSLAITASYLSQTIQGLEGLLQMPFGCGEQNMLLLNTPLINGLVICC